MDGSKPLDVVVIGGSVGGLSVAHALLQVGCSVTVFERAEKVVAAGAGLGLDKETCKVLESFGLGRELCQHSCDLHTEINRAVGSATEASRVMWRDDTLNHRSMHWSDLHRILYEGLPPGVVHMGHTVTGFQQLPEGKRVRMEVSRSAGSAVAAAPSNRRSERPVLQNDGTALFRRTFKRYT
eukprot:jgi/Botrbrau1/6312/Bobra.0339s0022.1